MSRCCTITTIDENSENSMCAVQGGDDGQGKVGDLQDVIIRCAQSREAMTGKGRLEAFRMM